MEVEIAKDDTEQRKSIQECVMKAITFPLILSSSLVMNRIDQTQN